jgi:hypothetical protein
MRPGSIQDFFVYWPIRVITLAGASEEQQTLSAGIVPSSMNIAAAIYKCVNSIII